MKRRHHILVVWFLNLVISSQLVASAAEGQSPMQHSEFVKDMLLLGVVPIIAAILGAATMPLFHALKRSLGPTFDDRQSLIGKYSCDWYIGEKEAETLYVTDHVEVDKIQGSRFGGNGTDSRFNYKLHGNISRGNVIAFYYIIHNRQLSLTGSGTLRMNPMGSQLEGKWYGYVSEDKLAGGRVVWRRIPDAAV
jgi:hypothetical protein